MNWSRTFPRLTVASHDVISTDAYRLIARDELIPPVVLVVVRTVEEGVSIFEKFYKK